MAASTDAALDAKKQKFETDHDAALDAKKQKLETDHDDTFFRDSTFENFQLKRILRDDQKAKFVCIEGTIKGSNKPAVVLLEKEHFTPQCLPRILSKETSLKETLKNDIYSTYQAIPPVDLAGFKSTLIYPATQKHIDKYCDHEPYIISETPHLYNTVTVPCLDKSNFSLQWVYNILEKKSEADRVVYEDADPDLGFVLLPDMKWNGKDVDSLYLVAIAHKSGIRSIRDLTDQHLPLLKNILEKGTKAICEKYGVLRSQLRMYFHYQPSYYHLHVHFTHLHYDAPGTDALRAHLLEDVIDNIETSGTFYQKKTLMFTIRENQELYKAYSSASYFS